jgi:hypothetical protein
MRVRTVGGLGAVLAGDFDDTALVPVYDKNGRSRDATLPQLRSAIVARGDATVALSAFAISTAPLALEARSTSANASNHWVGGHIFTKQTVANASGSIQGFEAFTSAYHTSGTLGAIYGLISNVTMEGAGGIVTTVYGLASGGVVSAGTVTNFRGLSIGGGTVQGGGAITNNYGAYIGPIAGGSVNWAIYCPSSTTSGGVCFRDTALTTGATVGHFFVPSCAGAPTGVPATIPAGQIAMHFDSTNNFLYAYLNSAWKKTTVFA